jgi:O-antigen ligase
MAPFYLQPRPLAGKVFSMVEITTLLCAVSWATRQLALWLRRVRDWRTGALQSVIPRRGLQLTPSLNIDLAVAFFVVVAVASTFVADYAHVALRELRVLIIEPAAFYLMLRTTRLGRRDTWRIVDLFVAGAAAVAIIGLAQYAAGANIITAEEGFRRLRSVYGSPNSVGLYMGRAVPLLAAVVLLGRERRRRWAYGLAIVPVLAALVLSFSKGALLIGLPASLVAVGILAGGWWLVGALATAVAALIAAIPLSRTPRFASLFDTTSGTTFFRLQLWQSAWDMFRDHPWLGVGPDNFLYAFRGRYIRPAAWQEPHISQAHNIVLDYATRMGIPGLVAGAWLQIGFWRLALPLRRLNDRDQRALAIGLMGAMVSFVAHGLVDASYFLIDLAYVFFLILGCAQWIAHGAANAQCQTDRP